MKYLNEILISWNSAEYAEKGTLNQNDIKKSFEKINLNNYKKSMHAWLDHETQYPKQNPNIQLWILDYINDILNLYFYNKKINFEEFVKQCIDLWEVSKIEAGNNWTYNPSKEMTENLLFHVIVENFENFGELPTLEKTGKKLFKVPENSELREICDISKISKMNDITFWNFTIFGKNGIIYWLVKINTPHTPLNSTLE